MQRAILRLNRYSPKKDASKKVTKALIFLFDGCEESEVVTIAGLLRQFDIEVILAGVQCEKAVTGAHYIRIIPDVDLALVENETFDIVIIPGGAGLTKLTDCPQVEKTIKKHNEIGKHICAIGSGIQLLNFNEIGYGKEIAACPSNVSELEKNYQCKNEIVVVDGNLITSQSPGNPFDLSFRIVDTLLSDESDEKELA